LLNSERNSKCTNTYFVHYIITIPRIKVWNDGKSC